VSEAIPDDVENLFEAILSQGNAAMNTGNGWVGSLTNFSGGNGYWVIVDEALSFSYNIGSEYNQDDGLSRNNVDPLIKVAQSSEQAFYFVDYIKLLDGFVEEGDILISYNGDIPTGQREWTGEMIDIPVMGKNEYDVRTAKYFIEGDTPTFKLKKGSELISLEGDIDRWISNGVFVVSGLHEIKTSLPIPLKTSLAEPFPNPFNPTTTISFGLKLDSEVSIQIYNLQGRVVETLTSEYMQAGYHSVTWNADNFSSGVYFVKMATSAGINKTQKLLLVK
jgi:hypothetical protein